MIALLCFVLNVLISPFKSKSRLEGFRYTQPISSQNTHISNGRSGPLSSCESAAPISPFAPQYRGRGRFIYNNSLRLVGAKRVAIANFRDCCGEVTCLIRRDLWGCFFLFVCLAAFLAKLEQSAHRAIRHSCNCSNPVLT